MALKKKDFIEMEFTGKTAEGNVFDSNIKADLEEAGLKQEAKPFIFALGEGMFMKAIDEFLIGKDVGEYKVDLTPDKAFGQRNPQMVQLMPTSIFIKHQINPVQGAMFNFDNKIGKILSVSGGRVRVDFNHPLAGQNVSYKVNVVRKIEKLDEKIQSFIGFLFQKDMKFEVKDKKIILEAEKGMKQFAELFGEKFKEIFELDLEVKEVGVGTKSETNKNADTTSKK